MSSAVYSVLTLPVLLGAGALVVDHGLLRMSRGELQIAADAGALAGAQMLSNVDAAFGPLAFANDEALVRDEATRVASQNRLLNQGVQPSEVTVEIGRYDAATGAFTPDAAYGDYVRTTVSSTRIPVVLGGVSRWLGYRATATSVAGRPQGGDLTHADPESCYFFAEHAATQADLVSLLLAVDADIRLESTDISACANVGLAGAEVETLAAVDLTLLPAVSADIGFELDASFSDIDIPNALDSAAQIGTYALPAALHTAGGGVVQLAGDYAVAATGSEGAPVAAGSVTWTRERIRVDGETTIFINGDLTISGGVIGEEGMAELLTLVVLGDHTVTIDGGAQVFARIIAQDADVQVLPATQSQVSAQASLLGISLLGGGAEVLTRVEGAILADAITVGASAHVGVNLGLLSAGVDVGVSLAPDEDLAGEVPQADSDLVAVAGPLRLYR